VAALADIAAGYSAMSLGAPDSEVTTVEFKINFINGAVGDAIEATGVVEKAGRSLVIARVEVEAITGADRKTCALMQATMMPVLKKY
jgi:acyl-coenzyme A thioesterase PaaI-like protein